MMLHCNEATITSTGYNKCIIIRAGEGGRSPGGAIRCTLQMPRNAHRVI